MLLRASRCALFSPSRFHYHHHHFFYVKNCQVTPPLSYNSIVFQAARLGSPAKFKASPTATSQLTSRSPFQRSSIVISWGNLYNRDAVVAEWANVRGNLFLDVHYYVRGMNPLRELAAELRYHIFSKELPLVLEAVQYGDSVFFNEHQELMDAFVRFFFHSRSKKYNRLECRGPVKYAA